MRPNIVSRSVLIFGAEVARSLLFLPRSIITSTLYHHHEIGHFHNVCAERLNLFALLIQSILRPPVDSQRFIIYCILSYARFSTAARVLISDFRSFLLPHDLHVFCITLFRFLCNINS